MGKTQQLPRGEQTQNHAKETRSSSSIAQTGLQVPGLFSQIKFPSLKSPPCTDAMTFKLLPQGFQAGAAFLCSPSFRGHFGAVMPFFFLIFPFSVVLSPSGQGLLAVTSLQEVTAQFTAASKALQISTSSHFRLLANSSTNLPNQLQMKGYFFPMTTKR